MQHIATLPTPQDVLTQLPLSPGLPEKIAADREEVKQITQGQSPKKLLIIGPCSIDFNDSVLQYAQQLKDLADQVEDKIKIVMRFHTEKPRSTVGRKGALTSADPLSPATMAEGVIYSRQLMRAVVACGLPVSKEMLYPTMVEYDQDLVSYVAIGARTTECQPLREIASGLPVAVGVKNIRSGDIKASVNSLISVRSAQRALLGGSIYETTGNQAAQIILRGYDQEGSSLSNYQRIDEFTAYLDKVGVASTFLVDCNHDNSGKDPLKQQDIMLTVQGYNKPAVVGYMVESYLHDGKQKLGSDTTTVKGCSLTDPCLGRDKTVTLVQALYDSITLP